MKASELYRDLQKGAETIPSSQLKLLFCEMLQGDFAMLMCMDEDISPESAEKCLKAKEELINGKPLAHVLSMAYFLDRKFTVSKDVLIPRPETELLVWTLLQEYKSYTSLNVLDMCCGSGAIGVSLCAEHPEWSVTLCDISPKALEISKINANALCSKAPSFVLSDMFSNIQGVFDLIVSNPPYIKRADIPNLEKSVKDFEPHLALDGGEDGLDFYRIIARKAPSFLTDNGKIALEIGFDEGEAVADIFSSHNFSDIEVKKDLTGEDRFVFCTYHNSTRQ